MKLFRWKKGSYEKLPPQIAKNALIKCWHHGDDGKLAYLVIDGTADSYEGKRQYERNLRRFGLGAFIGFFVLNGVLEGPPAGVAWLSFWIIFALTPVLVWISKRLARETRICTITPTTLTVERPDDTIEYDLNGVVGVQVHQLDQQRVNQEWRERRKEKDPEMIAPFSMDLLLETNLGQVDLGSVYGLQDARAIADAINRAIQFMKGRTGTGNNAAVNPEFQYRRKTAGKIPA